MKRRDDLSSETVLRVAEMAERLCRQTSGMAMPMPVSVEAVVETTERLLNELFGEGPDAA